MSQRRLMVLPLRDDLSEQSLDLANGISKVLSGDGLSGESRAAALFAVTAAFFVMCAPEEWSVELVRANALRLLNQDIDAALTGRAAAATPAIVTLQ